MLYFLRWVVYIMGVWLLILGGLLATGRESGAGAYTLLVHDYDTTTSDDLYQLSLLDSAGEQAEVRTLTNEKMVLFSPDGKWLYLDPDREGVSRASVTGQGRRYIAGDFTFLSNIYYVSPDQQWMAFFTEGNLTTWHMTLIRADGSGRRILVPDMTTYVTHMIWSPDMAWLYWSACATGWYEAPCTLNRIHLTSGQTETLIELPLAGSVIASAWSADGTWLALTGRNDTVPMWLWVYHTPTGELRQVTTAQNISLPYWVGKALIYATTDNPTSRIYRWEPGQDEAEVLVETAMYHAKLQFSPDQQAVYYQERLAERVGLFRLALAGGEPELLLDHLVAWEYQFPPPQTPQGDLIVMQRTPAQPDPAQEKWTYYRVSADGITRQALVTVNSQPFWIPYLLTPDQQWVLYRTPFAVSYGFHQQRVHLATGVIQTLPDVRDTVTPPTFSALIDLPYQATVPVLAGLGLFVLSVIPLRRVR